MAPNIVGVDVGVKTMFAAAPANAPPEVDTAIAVEGEEQRELLDEFKHAYTHAGSGNQTTVLERYRDRLLNGLADAVAELLAFLEALDAGVVALEDLGHEHMTLSEWSDSGRDHSAWMLPEILARLEEVLTAEGYRVEHVSPENTTTECHYCLQNGAVGRATLSCTEENCPVDRVSRDRSAAVSVANRAADDWR